MSVTVRLYAGVKEKAGARTLAVEGASIAELRAALAEACPPIAEQLSACRFAMNDEFVDEDAVVPADAVVDLIPPVSGG